MSNWGEMFKQKWEKVKEGVEKELILSTYLVNSDKHVVWEYEGNWHVAFVATWVFAFWVINRVLDHFHIPISTLT